MARVFTGYFNLAVKWLTAVTAIQISFPTPSVGNRKMIQITRIRIPHTVDPYQSSSWFWIPNKFFHILDGEEG